MLDVLLVTCLAALAPQDPVALAGAVAVRGDAELTPAAAFASARRKAEDYLRDQWQERADRTSAVERPFWLPEPLVTRTVERWIGDLPVERALRLVDREDRERTHEFGNSYQTTLWVAEEPRIVEHAERTLRQRMRQLERTTALKYGGIAGGWVVLTVLLGWIDRLSRGYMTGRLRCVGLLGAIAIPAVAFLL